MGRVRVHHRLFEKFMNLIILINSLTPSFPFSQQTMGDSFRVLVSVRPGHVYKTI